MKTSDEWRESLKSKNSPKAYEYITSEKIVPEYYRNHKRVKQKRDGIIQRIKNHSQDDDIEWRQHDRRKAVDELEDLELEIGKIFGSLTSEEQKDVLDDYKQLRGQIMKDQEKIADGGYAGTTVF